MISLSSCVKDVQIDTSLPNIPAGFPEMEYPQDNGFSQERWELGRSLFFDKRLSRNNSISCASCHHPALAFSDSLSVSLGVEGRLGTRNAPSLANVGYHPYLTREGGVKTLEMQVLVPIQEHNEFDFNIIEIVDKLANDSVLQAKNRIAYQRDLDAFSLVRAIATFERSLISGNSAYDQYVYQGRKSAMSNKEINGMNLFFGEKTNCSSCHGGFNFTNYAFENNGLYTTYEDIGRQRLTGIKEDNARFKVPSLRNVGVTAPYMHDGSMQTLEDVIEHYNSGGKSHFSKSQMVQPLHLTKQEKEELLAFLNSLTDVEFLQNLKFRKE